MRAVRCSALESLEDLIESCRGSVRLAQTADLRQNPQVQGRPLLRDRCIGEKLPPQGPQPQLQVPWNHGLQHVEYAGDECVRVTGVHPAAINVHHMTLALAEIIEEG